MSERPLAKFEDGRLWLDVGGVYEPSSRFSILMRWETFRHWDYVPAKNYARDLKSALDQYDKAMEEAKCEAATH
jgi:hypothetical protein